MGGFLAGFIEGEGCFSIVRQTRGYGYRCWVSLNARDDDAALINDIAASTRLGTVRRQPAQATSRPQVRWTVMAKSDCRRLIALLYAYPLRGRKARDFAIWAAAANWWIGSDPTDRRPSRDWDPMPYLKERLSEAKGYDPLLYACTDSGPPGLSCDWPDYLAGFVTAEGHLGVVEAAPGSFAPRLTIRVRADDAPLMAELRDRLQAGKVYGPYGGGGRNPVLNWIVLSSEDLRRTVTAFDDHPPRGRKRVEYRLWKEAVEIYAASSGFGKAHQQRLSVLRRELKRVRAYPAK